MLFIYMLVAIAQLRLRNRFEREAPERLKLRMWLHPWATLATIVGMGSVLVVMAVEPARQIELASSTAVGLAFFVVWWFVRRGKA
jgi:L-asparagine transporter-like permease